MTSAPDYSEKIPNNVNLRGPVWRRACLKPSVESPSGEQLNGP